MVQISVGVCFHRDEPASDVIGRAQAAETQGFDEFWVIEDCFFTAGVSLATAALVATSTITVGIGILPVVARNAAVTAMEIATIAQIAPGRFHAGLGHGVQSWMEQMNERVASPLTALHETFDAVGALLRGDEVTVEGRYVQLDGVRLDQPPATMPLLSAGVRGPKSLAIAGHCADGVILADFVSADYVRWVVEQTGRSDHRITVFSSLGVGPADAADDIGAGMRGHLGEVAADAPVSLRMASFWPEFEAAAAATSWHEAAQAAPDEWLHEVCAFGTPANAAAYVRGLAEAGADAVAFFPSPFDPLADTAYAAEHVLPLLR